MKEPAMTFLNRISEAFDILGAALRSSHAVRNHHRPAPGDLALLGIDAKEFTPHI
jgi:hypothetical protein